jgi:PhzF family phenazine biosynthesis protein
MQMTAREMNLSETAFVVSERNGFGLHWFTPRTEVDFCGHATCAAPHILWEEGYLIRNESARFFTKSGTLSARKAGDFIELDFPAVPEEPVPGRSGLSQALGIRPLTGKTRFDYLIEVSSEE